MKLYKCDKCGSIIKNELSINRYENLTEIIDLCGKCDDALREWLNDA